MGADQEVRAGMNCVYAAVAAWQEGFAVQHEPPCVAPRRGDVTGEGQVREAIDDRGVRRKLDREKPCSLRQSQQEERGDGWKMEAQVEDERGVIAVAELLESMASRSATHSRVVIERCCESTDVSRGMVDHDQRTLTVLLLLLDPQLLLAKYWLLTG